ncbi:MAG: PhnD/SsuA/transferrin family substrate-binding protein [Candidatus Electrothrix aestuarii]|uniref:PhnD/SsuA/transferrin family substrate-binding protein n=1 Tax=Candidatus Electrothrix aestuarii TaxID=3062594 RepID=A0AAU8LUI1_9BACT|nr:PhnD/SsuA/transferrin family substrate-binding protein [Candidatus Electrothrix aestuarii]
MKYTSLKAGIISTLLTALLLTSGATLLFPTGACSAENNSIKFYYFNPDSAQSNLTRLKEVMEQFLQQNALPLDFQPFAKYHDFHREMARNKPAFVFLPEWYIQKNKGNYKLTPLLQAIRQGQKTYRKVLLTAKDSKLTVQSLHNKTLAMTSMGEDSSNILSNLFKVAANSLNIIATPKDADALFALAMHQVDAALVSKNNLLKIGALNPRITDIVFPLAESKPIPLPLLCVVDQVPNKKVMMLKKVFLDAKRSDESSNLMEMLQIDAWHNYSH